MTSLEQARRIAALTQDKLARDVVIMDMQPVCSYTDYFVVVTGNNPRQTKAIWDEVHSVLKHDESLLPRSVAGEGEATWIVADYLDVGDADLQDGSEEHEGPSVRHRQEQAAGGGSARREQREAGLAAAARDERRRPG